MGLVIAHAQRKSFSFLFFLDETLMAMDYGGLVFGYGSMVWVERKAQPGKGVGLASFESRE